MLTSTAERDRTCRTGITRGSSSVVPKKGHVPGLRTTGVTAPSLNQSCPHFAAAEFYTFLFTVIFKSLLLNKLYIAPLVSNNYHTHNSTFTPVYPGQSTPEISEHPYRKGTQAFHK